jgi:hypothetical protein
MDCPGEALNKRKNKNLPMKINELRLHGRRILNLSGHFPGMGGGRCLPLVNLICLDRAGKKICFYGFSFY